MRKLIEMDQEHLIVCDNCDYKVENPSRDPHVSVKQYVNKPCPECGSNLLTEEDYLTSKKVLKFVDFVNKWFSWLTLFYPKSATKHRSKIHVHKGVHVKEVNNAGNKSKKDS